MGVIKKGAAVPKGQPGRISFLKKKELFTALSLFALSAAIFVTGLLLNDYDKGNIWTIIAAVVIIPVARALTGFVLVFPFKDAPKELTDEVDKTAKPGCIIYTDVIVTSTEKAIGLSFIVITGSGVIILTGRKSEDIFGVRDYLADYVKRRGYSYKVTVAEDTARFFALLKNSDSPSSFSFANEDDRLAYEQERGELCEALESLMV